MAKDKLTDYDATAGNNTDIGGISVDEGMLPSNVNNAIREIMSHLKDFAAGTQAVDAVAINGDLTVDTNTLVVDSTNNRVGIGDTSPTSKLDLGSDVGSSVTDVTNHIGLYASLYGFGVTSNQLNYVSGADHVFYNTSGNERVRILGTGGLTFNGDTAAANALSDFETGTFTPVFDQSGTAISGVTTDINTGKYTKIGNKVTVQIYLHTTAAGSPTSSALTVGNLPFNAANVSNVLPSVSIGYVANFVTANPTTGFLQTNTDYIRLFTTASADARTNSATVAGTYLGSDTYLILNATYLTS